MAPDNMTGREILEEALRLYDKTYCDAFPPIRAEVEEERRCRKRERRPFFGCLNRLSKRVAGIMVAVSMLLVGAISEAPVASSAYTEVYSFRNDTVVVDGIECNSRSEYTDDKIYAFSIMRSLRGIDPVLLEAKSGVTITYTTGETEQSEIRFSQKHVSEHYDGVYTTVEIEYDETRIISRFTVYHWYYANGEYLYGTTYVGDYGIDNN